MMINATRRMQQSALWMATAWIVVTYYLDRRAIMLWVRNFSGTHTYDI